DRWQLVCVSRTECRDDLPCMVQTHILTKLHQHSPGHKRFSLRSNRRAVDLSVFLCSSSIEWKSKAQEHYCAEQKTNGESRLLHRLSSFFRSCRLRPACGRVRISGRW